MEKKRTSIYMVDGGETLKKIKEILPTYHKERNTSEIVMVALEKLLESLLAE